MSKSSFKDRQVKIFYNADLNRLRVFKALEDEINDWAAMNAITIVNTSISCIDRMSFCAIVTYEGEASDE